MKKLAIFTCIFVLLPFFSIAGDDIFFAMGTKLKFLNQRQALISKNIANADTPGYKARDLKGVDFNNASKSRSQIKLKTTSPSHLGSDPQKISFRKMRQKDTYDTSPDGNNVVLEEQMVKMSENDLEFRATAGVMKQMTGLLRAAIGDKR